MVEQPTWKPSSHHSHLSLSSLFCRIHHIWPHVDPFSRFLDGWTALANRGTMPCGFGENPQDVNTCQHMLTVLASLMVYEKNQFKHGLAKLSPVTSGQCFIFLQHCFPGCGGPGQSQWGSSTSADPSGARHGVPDSSTREDVSSGLYHKVPSLDLYTRIWFRTV